MSGFGIDNMVGGGHSVLQFYCMEYRLSLLDKIIDNCIV